MSEEEEELVSSWNNDNNHFDVIIGLIEDIIVDPEFVNLQNDFMNKHYKVFEECEENKLEYMEIFNSYTELIEKHIETSLLKKMPEFSMKDFLKDISLRYSELEGDVFDMLVSFTDFISFKEMFLDYKAAKTGCIPDLSIQNTKEYSMMNSK